jgi:hypothetical protein
VDVLAFAPEERMRAYGEFNQGIARRAALHAWAALTL